MLRLSNIKEVEGFLNAVNECESSVWLESQYGDKFNLKSKLSQYVALSALLGENGDELMLFCSLREDEAKLLKFFHDFPDAK